MVKINDLKTETDKMLAHIPAKTEKEVCIRRKLVKMYINRYLGGTFNKLFKNVRPINNKPISPDKIVIDQDIVFMISVGVKKELEAVFGSFEDTPDTEIREIIKEGFSSLIMNYNDKLMIERM